MDKSGETDGIVNFSLAARAALIVMIVVLAIVLRASGCWLFSSLEEQQAERQAEIAARRVSVGMTREQVEQALAEARRHDVCGATEDRFLFGSDDPAKAGVVLVVYRVTGGDDEEDASGAEKPVKPESMARVERVTAASTADLAGLDKCSLLDLAASAGTGRP